MIQHMLETSSVWGNCTGIDNCNDWRLFFQKNFQRSSFYHCELLFSESSFYIQKTKVRSFSRFHWIWCCGKPKTSFDYVFGSTSVMSVWLLVGTDESHTSSGMIFWVSSFVWNTCNVLFLPDTFSNGAEIPMCSPRSDFAMTLVTSHPEDAFFELCAHSILVVIILSIAVKFAFWILSPTVSAILPISLSIFSLKHLSKVFTFNKFSLAAGLLSELLTVISWATVSSFTVAFCCLPFIVLL